MENQLTDTSYPYDFNENKKWFVVTISEDILPDKIHATFLNIVEDKRGSVQYRNIMWLMQNANIPAGFTYVDVLEKAQTISYFFPVGLTAIVVDPNSSIQRQASEYYKNIALLNTQRVVQIFNSVEEAEIWLDSVK